MASSENQLIAQLPDGERRRLLALSEPFEMVLSTELSERGRPLTHAHFPREGFISLVIDREGYPPLEVGMVGRESMLGSELVLGLAQTPWRAVVHGPGDSWRVSAAALRRALNALPVLRRVMQASLLVRLHQQVLTAACERFHMVEPRLARRLLMSQDRAQADSFPITQELLALLLGVRRVSVTQAAGHLQRAGLIQYHRGKITVLDRKGLMEESCHCYQADRQLLNELSINARPS